MSSLSQRQFKCSWDTCEKSFDRNSDLRRHSRIHTNERPYHCRVKGCNKGFIQRSALTVHTRTHTGERPYICDHEGCQKSFSDSSSLARHRRIHVGKRPYNGQEPTCKRRPCRRTALMNQPRAQLLQTATQIPSEDTSSEQLFLPPFANSPLHHQYLYDHQACYPNIAVATHDFYSLPTALVAVETQPASVIRGNQVILSLEVQDAQAQLMQQQQYGQRCTGYSPVQYPPPYALPTAEGHPLTTTPMYQYKLPTELLTKPSPGLEFPAVF
ncbi:hypothetical protein BJX76DRAFT_352736 [Aspergillus varians]